MRPRTSGKSMSTTHKVPGAICGTRGGPCLKVSLPQISEDDIKVEIFAMSLLRLLKLIERRL